MLKLVLTVVAYVLLALGLFVIGKRRGIEKAWLAWIPIGNLWIMGSISDNYRYAVTHQYKNRRKLMMVLLSVLLVLAVVLGYMLAALAVELVSGLGMRGKTVEMMLADPQGVQNFIQYNAEWILQSLGKLLLVVIPMLTVAIWCSVLTYMAMYDIFASCDPKHKTLYTVLSIVANFVGLGIVMPVLLMLCFRKDDGMPPLEVAGAAHRAPGLDIFDM